MASVGILSAFKIKGWNPATGWTGQDSSAIAYTSPWSTGAGLAPIIVSEGTILPGQGVTMADALSLPPVARAMMLYSGVLAGTPLVSQGADIPWLGAAKGALSAELRNVQMFQDLFFAGHTCLEVTRNADGTVQDAIRLPLNRWRLDEAGNVLRDEQLLDQDSFVYIPGLLPMGFLTYAASTIRHYQALVRTIESRGSNPVPLIAIEVADDCQLTDDEIDQVLDDWHQARNAKNGAVAIVPKGIKLTVLGDKADASQMLTDARNAARLDVANFVNLTAALVDGNNGTSGTYENTLQNQNEFSALSLPLFTKPIELRLSQDDVTPAGTVVRFDTSHLDQATSTDAQGNTGSAVGEPLAIPAPADQKGNE
jgi:hypothetical protein